MENHLIWNFEEVSARISSLTDVGQYTSDEFLTAFTKVLGEGLKTNDSVSIKDFGTFYRNSATGGVSFIASDILADAVNHPFSNFEKVELAEGYYPPEVIETREEEISTEPVYYNEQLPVDPQPIEEYQVEEEFVEDYPADGEEYVDDYAVEEQIEDDYPVEEGQIYEQPATGGYSQTFQTGYTDGYGNTYNDNAYNETVPPQQSYWQPNQHQQPSQTFEEYSPEPELSPEPIQPQEPSHQKSYTTYQEPVQETYPPYQEPAQQVVESVQPPTQMTPPQADHTVESNVTVQQELPYAEQEEKPEPPIPEPVNQTIASNIYPGHDETEERYEDEDEYEDNDESSDRISINRWVFWLGLVLGLCIGVIAGFFLRPIVMGESGNRGDTVDQETMFERLSDETLMMRDSVERMKNSFEEFKAHDESIKPQQIEAKPEVLLDTIKPGRFLAAMSRAHYGGRYEFWVYIYEENKDKIPDPDNVAIGTVLVIPPKEKYGIDPDSQASIDRALKLAREISPAK